MKPKLIFSASFYPLFFWLPAAAVLPGLPRAVLQQLLLRLLPKRSRRRGLP